MRVFAWDYNQISFLKKRIFLIYTNRVTVDTYNKVWYTIFFYSQTPTNDE